MIGRGLCLATMLFAASAWAGPAEIAHEAAELLKNAGARLALADSERAQVRAYGQTVQAYEAALLAAQRGLNDLARAEAAAQDEAARTEAALADLLVLLQRHQAEPAALATAHPSGPLAADRAAILMAAFAPQVADLAAARQASVARASTVLVLQQALRDDMIAALTDIRTARAAMLSSADSGRAPNAAAQAAAAQQSATDMDGLADELAALAQTPRAGLPLFDLARGGLAPVIAGDVRDGFGESGSDGVVRNGLRVAAAPGTLVTSPIASDVVYAGPFIDGAAAVVLQPAPGVLLAFQGLGPVFVETGAQVDSGAVLGALGGESDADEEFLIELGTSDGAFLSEWLYIELRIDGIATDPAPFFERGGGLER